MFCLICSRDKIVVMIDGIFPLGLRYAGRIGKMGKGII